MVINKLKILILSLCFVFPVNYSAQNVNINLEILQDLAQLDLTAFINFGKGNFDALSVPVILQISMDYPTGNQVVLSGKVNWKSPDGKLVGELISFSSNPFTNIKLINNQEFNKKIIFNSPVVNNKLIDENTKRGKPSGTYTIYLTLTDLSNGESANTQQTIEITNPTQTFYIQSPMPQSQNDIAGVTAIWDALDGAKEYKILANVRKNKKQSLEEALNSSAPLINNRSVGLQTSVNLANLLERQWLPGQEIVFRVTAIVPAAHGNQEINSANVVNFYILSQSSEEDKSRQKIYNDILNNIISDIGNMNPQEDENLSHELRRAQQILEMIQSGQIDFSNAQIIDENGNILNYDELNNILDYLRKNPNALLNVNFQSN